MLHCAAFERCLELVEADIFEHVDDRAFAYFRRAVNRQDFGHLRVRVRSVALPRHQPGGPGPTAMAVE
jgi:hypothetical protein